MNRNDCIIALAGLANSESDLTVCNLGRTGYEWHAAFPSAGNLYSMGMGLVTPMALGMALALPHRRVLALDGDGSLLLDLGSLATVGTVAGQANLKIIVFDNEGYVSTGPQTSSTAHGTDLAAVAAACGIPWTATAIDLEEFESAAKELLAFSGAGLLVAKVAPDMGFAAPPTISGRENKYAFVRYIERTEGIQILTPSRANKFVPGSEDPEPAITPSAVDTVEALKAGMTAAEIDFVASLPSKELSQLQEWCAEDDRILHISANSEGEAAAICAGAWLAGRKPALVIASIGLTVAAYALLRCHRTFEIPLLMITTYRGDIGETEWYAVHIGPSVEPMLAAMGVQVRVARTLDDLAALPARMQATVDASLGLCCLIVGGELTEGYKSPRPRT